LNFTFIQIDTSSFGSFSKALHKIVGLFFIGLTFLFFLNAVVLIQNFNDIDLPLYLLPIVYFCIPFIFLFSSVAYFLEYYLSKRVKAIMYCSLVLIVLINDKYFFDIFGLNELNYLVNKNFGLSNKFALGYLKKTDSLSFISIDTILYPIYAYKKIGLILIVLLVTYFLSRISISRKINKKNNVTIHTSYDRKTVHFPKAEIKLLSNNSSNFYNLLKKDYYSFAKSVDKINVLMLSFLWLLLFVIKDDFLKMLVPTLFLFTFFINRFLSLLYHNNLEFYEKLSAYRTHEIILSKFVVIAVFYILLLVPLLIKASCIEILKIILGFLLLSIFQIIVVRLTKNNILMDILLVLLYSTYIFGTPIINIFQL